MNKLKKIFTIATISFTCFLSLLLILLLLNVNLFKDKTLNVLLIVASLSIGGFFSINSINMVNKSKIIGWVSFGLIMISLLLVCTLAWIGFDNILFLKITASFSLLSIVFNIIVSIRLSLSKRYLALQIVVYSLAGIVDLLATLTLFNAFKKGNGSGTTIFCILVILLVVGIVILKVLAKRKYSITQGNDEYIRVSKKEYDLLLEKAKKYDEILNNKIGN